MPGHFCPMKKSFTWKKLVLLIPLLIPCQSYAWLPSKSLPDGQWKSTERMDLILTWHSLSNGSYIGKNQDGHIVLKDIIYDANTDSFRGLLTPPGQNIQLPAKIVIETADQIKIQLRKFLMTKTIYLVKIKSE
jgi:hypothetical protein